MSFAEFVKSENMSLNRHISKVLASEYVAMSRQYIKKCLSNFPDHIKSIMHNWSKLSEKLLPWQLKDYKVDTQKQKKFYLAVDKYITDKLNEYDPLPATTGRQFHIGDFIKGYKATARDDAHNTWQCKIKISQNAWNQISSGGKAAGINTIKGIFTQENIWISDKSKGTGRRCIKPEPYGWIVSTSSSVRMVDVDTDVYLQHPTSLNFTKVMNVK